MTDEELNKIDISEYICNMLSTTSKSSIKDIAKKLKMTQKKVREIIEEGNLYYRAAWLKYDKKMFLINDAFKKIEKKKLLAESVLENELKKIKNPKGENEDVLQ